MKRLFALALSATLGTAGAAHAQLTLSPIGSYAAGLFDQSGAEIPAFDPVTQQLFVTNSGDGTVDVLDLSDPTAPSLVTQLPLGGGGPNSVAVSNGLVAVAVEAATVTDPGEIQFYDASTLTLTGTAPVGALPDSVVFTPDGSRLLVANEGEPDAGIDPVGSVSIIDVGTLAVTTAGFAAFNDANTVTTATLGNTPINAVRRDPNVATLAADVEPEFITVSPDGATAFVSLQEANSVGVLNLTTNSFDAILPLGVQDHSVPGFGLDSSDRDGVVNITTRPVFGLRQPDAIASYSAGGATFFVTANEGDDRGEDERIANLTLDPTAFPDAAALQDENVLGRLGASTFDGDTDGDGDFDQLFTYGSRSFTIFDASGAVVFDSGDAFEQITANTPGVVFNATNDENDSFESRSDNRGPEPEGLTLGEIDGRTFAFIGLERVGGVVVYDITDPANATFEEYLNPRDFSILDATLAADIVDAAGTLTTDLGALDLGPEGLLFIPAADSPIGEDLLVVTNEVSGTTTIFAVVPEPAGVLLLVMAAAMAGGPSRNR